jgi:5-formyltetrahydrofolate cyclo-ligase
MQKFALRGRKPGAFQPARCYKEQMDRETHHKYFDADTATNGSAGIKGRTTMKGRIGVNYPEIFGGKRRLRAETIAYLEQISEQFRLKQSRLVEEMLIELPEFTAAATVMCYIASPSHKEVETRQIIETAWNQGKTLIVPYCVGRGNLGLFRLNSWDELKPGRYGILEPLKELRPDDFAENRNLNIDVVILPGVAFDQAGRRLGRGGGYYDRFLASQSGKTNRVALAFERQIHHRVPIEKNDQPVHLIVTEKNVYRC